MVHRMKELREKCKFSKQEVERYLRIPAVTYEKMENGRLEPGSMTALYLALLYGVTVNYFLGIDDRPVPEGQLWDYRHRVYPLEIGEPNVLGFRL